MSATPLRDRIERRASIAHEAQERPETAATPPRDSLPAWVRHTVTAGPIRATKELVR
jgi:hypothetical protein